MPYQFIPDGDANFYMILDETGHWLARVQVNGELTSAQQKALLEHLTTKLVVDPTAESRIRNAEGQARLWQMRAKGVEQMLTTGVDAMNKWTGLVSNVLLAMNKMPPPDDGKAMKLFRLNDCEWWVGPSLEEVKAFYTTQIDEEGLDAPREITDSELDTLMYLDESLDGERMVTRTFRQQLALELAAGGEFPRLFATTEY